MVSEQIRAASIARARGIATPSGAAVILSFMLGYNYWQSYVLGDFSFVIFRLVFLTAVLLYLKGMCGVPIQQATGTVGLPEKRHLGFLAFALGAAVTVRLVLKLHAQSVSVDFDTIDLTPYNLFYECVIPPLSEEPVFRGVILTALSVLFKDRIGAILIFSSLTFSAVHNPYNIGQQIGTFGLGMITTLVALRTRSLSSCMVLHAIWNALVFI